MSMRFNICKFPGLIPSPCLEFRMELWHWKTIRHQFTVITARPQVDHLSKPADQSPSILPKWQLYGLDPGLSSVGQWDRASVCLSRVHTKGYTVYIWFLNDDVAQGFLVLFLVRKLNHFSSSHSCCSGPVSLYCVQDIANYCVDMGVKAVMWNLNRCHCAKKKIQNYKIMYSLKTSFSCYWAALVIFRHDSSVVL